jgi:thymidine phosphorylase
MLDIITRKRDGRRMSDADIRRFVKGLTDGSLPREQVAALAMAIYLRSMDSHETAALTAGMARSGQIIDWSTYALDGPVLDKHSTGGVGDKVSLVLAPIVAACGGYVPMVSGRGLGHTGGTLDKLGSIPGYQPWPGVERLQAVVADVGCAIVGQTRDLAPADRALYAIRDMTATIESTPLIIASILSKKMAASLDGLVLDVKTGAGAFMMAEDDARALAEAIVATAGEMGLPARALITGMDASLGGTVGNALEVAEAISYLTGGERSPRLHEVVAALAVEMLMLGGIEGDVAMAAARVERALSSGAAAERFARMVHALGGPADLIKRRDWHLRRAAVFRPVPAERSGYLAAVDARAIGIAVMGLGGGRGRIDHPLDVSVGFSHVVPLGGQVEAGEPMAMVHAASEDEADRAIAAYRAACAIDSRSHLGRPMIRAIIGRVA